MLTLRRRKTPIQQQQVHAAANISYFYIKTHKIITKGDAKKTIMQQQVHARANISYFLHQNA